MVNLDVCTIQATGRLWERRNDDESLAKGISSGELKLAPHALWRFEFPIDWDADPFGQNNWKFQLHTLRWVDPLRRVALSESPLSGMAAECWNSIVWSWISKKLKSRDKYAWMDMADGQRTIALVLGFPLVEEHKRQEFLAVVKRHVKHLSKYSNRGHGNHELHQILALYIGGKFLDDERFVAQALKDAVGLFSNAYDAQGVNEEASIGYQDLNYVWWNELLTHFEAGGDDLPEVRKLLDKSREWLVHSVRPDGTFETIGDTNPGKRISKDDTPTTEYVTTAGRKGVPPEERSFVASAGYAFGRSGWGEYERDFADETFYSLRFGRNDAIHGHPDSTSFTIFAAGKPWIVDPGMYAYKSSPFRRFMLSRRAHNVVCSETVDFDKAIQPKLVHTLQNDFVDYYVMKDYGYPGFEIVRHFAYLRSFDGFVVFDSVERTDPAVPFARFEQTWHLAPGTEVELSKGRSRLTLENDLASIRWSNRPGLRSVEGLEQPEYQGWFCTKYSEAASAPVVAAVSSRRGIVDWLCTFSLDSAPLEPIDWKFDSNDFRESRLSIRVNGKQTDIQFTPNGIVIDDGGDEKSTSNANHIVVRRPEGLDLTVVPDLDDSGLTASTELLRRWASNEQLERSEAEAGFYVLAQQLVEAGNPTVDSGAKALLGDLAALSGRDVKRIAIQIGCDRAPLALQSGKPVHNRKKGFSSISVQHESMLEDSKRWPDRTVIVFRSGGLASPMMVSNMKKDGRLFVPLRGAVRREKADLPLFGGIGMGVELNCPTVVPADPTLDLDSELTLGWYVGSINSNSHQDIASRLESLALSRNAPEIVIVGSSGGGFAALMIGSWITKCQVRIIVFNPQTDILKYYPGKVDRFTRAVFGVSSTQLTPDQRRRLDTKSAIARYGQNVSIEYIQNSSDEFHTEFHLKSFVDEFHSSGTEATLAVDYRNWGNGHVAPSSDEIISQVRHNHGIE